MSIFLIAGLGNPGPEYHNTKHNIGFLTLDKIQAHFNAPEFTINKKFHSLVSEVTIGEHKVILAKPLTFMNNSGQALRAIKDYYKVEMNNILPIYDDIDLDFGKLRIRPSGGAGTHNGMKSIIEHLGSEDFPRLRLGIGKPHPQQDLRDYVLDKFGKSEETELADFLKKTPLIAEEWIKTNIETAMNAWN